MCWVVSNFDNVLISLCGAFYAILCIFSIVTGILYVMGKRKLNPLELSNKFVKKLESENKINNFAVKMGYITIIVGILQGITSFAIFKGHSVILYIIALGFTLFSILSVLFKLKGKINTFSIIKLILYILILIVLLLGNIRVQHFNL